MQPPIVKTPLFPIYVHHLFALAEGVRHGCARVFELAAIPAVGNAIQVSPELHAAIDGALIAAANLKKLITAPTEKPKKISRQLFSFRIARANTLRGLLDGLSITELLNADVRNSLEHFDERLDALNLRFASGEPGSAPMAAYNMAFSSWEVTSPRVFPIRLYISAEKKYYNLEHSLDLGKLHDEATTILERLRGTILKGLDAPGGLMLRLPQ